VLILTLDSCGSSCATGVWQDGNILVETTEHMERGQDARLIPMVMDVMERSKKTFADLDRIAVTRGPGSFTGARVGLAAARGFGLASGKAVIGVDRFRIYHHLYKNPAKNLLVVITSKRAELFCKFYPRSGSTHEATLMTEEAIKDFMAKTPETLIAGDGVGSDEAILEACGTIAASADVNDEDFLPRPLYLRAPDVTVSSR
jgi:tRNA threonylcarbamoyladenosine biosynthesis protein TsaB